MPLFVANTMAQNAVEPMQVDAPPEDNDNNEEENYVVENPSLDLEVYANSYSGLAKLYRLIYIIDHCPSLRLEALKTAISYVMTTYNVNLYQVLHQKLAEVTAALNVPDVAAPSTSQLSSFITCLYIPGVFYFLHKSGTLYKICDDNVVLYIILVEEVLRYAMCLPWSKLKKSKKVDKENQIIKEFVNIFKTFLATAIVAVVFHIVSVLLGAPLYDNFGKTFRFSLLISMLTVLPHGLLHGAQIIVYLFSSLMDSEITFPKCILSVRLTIFGAWLGSCLIPLDWDKPYQVWPTPCCLGALAGCFFANLIQLISPERLPKRDHGFSLCDHYLDCGDLSNALKCYSRARDYCTSGKHVVNMCLNVIKVSVYLQNWSHVLSYVSKAESTPDFCEQTKDSNQIIMTKLKCAAGLAELATKKYKSAAKHFLQANLDHCDFPELLSPNNVAMYGGLCALATFDRHELQKNVIFSSSFKLFLELEPQLRDIIFKFYESKYAQCLKLLDEIKDNLLLDMYIAPHITTLYMQIRNRALIQYFSPYLSADMHKMAEAFNRTVPALEDELMQLILEGQIQARIDSHNKILFAKDVDQRSTTFEKSLLIGKEYQRRTRMLILRAAVLKNKIHVKSPQRETGQAGDITVAPGTSTVLTARN
nr:unnamed protein product [Callosobruchus chinensis]